MKYLIILAHPDKRSFNSSIARTVLDYIQKSGNKVILHDLYEENFNPTLTLEEINRKFSFEEPIQRYSIELSEADHLIFIYPDWWGQMPAILKGWIDRVFRQGTAFEYDGAEFEEKEKMPLLSGKRATIVITTDREAEPMAIEEIWKNDILAYCGIEDAEVLIYYSARTAGIQERNVFLKRVISRINKND